MLNGVIAIFVDSSLLCSLTSLLECIDVPRGSFSQQLQSYLVHLLIRPDCRAIPFLNRCTAEAMD